eukprot:m.242354 g.242354  ORF g.242354 m.242354 type:complete len:395 (+) comp16093_c0_seq1:252-1436(+)
MKMLLFLLVFAMDVFPAKCLEFDVNPCLMGFPVIDNATTTIPTTESNQTTATSTVSWYCECPEGFSGNLCQYSALWTCNDHGTPNANGSCVCNGDQVIASWQADQNSAARYDWSGPQCQFFRFGTANYTFLVIYFLVFFGLMALCVSVCFCSCGEEFDELDRPSWVRFMLGLTMLVVVLYEVYDFASDSALLLFIRPRSRKAGFENIEPEGSIWYSEFYSKYTLRDGKSTRRLHDIFAACYYLGIFVRGYVLYLFAMCTIMRVPEIMEEHGPHVIIFLNVLLLIFVEVPGIWVNVIYSDTMGELNSDENFWVISQFVTSGIALTYTLFEITSSTLQILYSGSDDFFQDTEDVAVEVPRSPRKPIRKTTSLFLSDDGGGMLLPRIIRKISSLTPS